MSEEPSFGTADHALNCTDKQRGCHAGSSEAAD